MSDGKKNRKAARHADHRTNLRAGQYAAHHINSDQVC